MTMVDGVVLVDRFALTQLDRTAIVAEAKLASRALYSRAGV